MEFEKSRGLEENPVTDEREYNWWRAYNNIFEYDISPHTFKVYCYLCMISTAKNYPVHLSHKKIAIACKVGKSTVIKAIAELESEELLKYEKQLGEDGEMRSNKYTLLNRDKFATTKKEGKLASWLRAPTTAKENVDSQKVKHYRDMEADGKLTLQGDLLIEIVEIESRMAK
jgi:hypothetical protein